jgi:glutamate-5-semialdehyde dehydrogenase
MKKDRRELALLCLAAKEAASVLGTTSPEARNRALETMATALEKNRDDLIFKNSIDVDAGSRGGLSEALLDRLTLTKKRVQDMAQGLREMAALPDPLREIIEERRCPNGLRVQKVRVPLGVVAMVYEARPTVTIDSAGLCLKSGNAVILRGGKEAINSNRALAHLAASVLEKTGLPAGCIQLVGSTDRALIRDLVRMDRCVDLVIPRGGEEMVRAIREMATVPVLSHGRGLCTVYVDNDADLPMARQIAFNAKVQRPGVCNAMETLLVHKDVARTFLPSLCRQYQKAGIQVRGDREVCHLVGRAIKPIVLQDWDTEFLGPVVAVGVVPSIEDAIRHINHHGSHHSDSIVTKNRKTAERFLHEVDSAAVFHNASTRLHDGSVLGLGAEMGISTQKLHARGTMGLKELTTTKYVVRGTGQIRE